MSDENNKLEGSAGQAGSPIEDNSVQIKAGPDVNSFGDGQPDMGSGGDKSAEQDADETVSKKMYEELEKKLGMQGKEIGDWKSWHAQLKPLLDVLESNPKIVDSVLTGKINDSLIESVVKGETDPEAAKVVTEANKQVMNKLGKEEYKNASPDKIMEMVNNVIEEKLGTVKKDVQKSFSNLEKEREFQKRQEEFVASKPDFYDYAEKIDKWLDEHNVSDLEIAYYAVKGREADLKREKSQEIDASNLKKEVALNGGGEGSKGSSIPQGKSLIDSLVSDVRNPNSF